MENRKHLGKRAKLNNQLGYFFETIEMSEHQLFVYDSKIGHSESPYFEKHPNVDMFKKDDVTVTEKKIAHSF